MAKNLWPLEVRRRCGCCDWSPVDQRQPGSYQRHMLCRKLVQSCLPPPFPPPPLFKHHLRIIACDTASSRARLHRACPGKERRPEAVKRCCSRGEQPSALDNPTTEPSPPPSQRRSCGCRSTSERRISKFEQLQTTAARNHRVVSRCLVPHETPRSLGSSR